MASQPKLSVKANSVAPIRPSPAPRAERRAIGGGLTKRVHRLKAQNMWFRLGGPGVQS